MELENYTFLELIRIKDAEVWQIKNTKPSFKTRGYLQVLYSKTLKLFVLKVHDFKFALHKALQVITTFNEKDKIFSYMLPIPDGFYMIKLLHSQPNPAITNLETVLENTAYLLRRTGLEQKLVPGKDSGLFHKIGEVARDGILTAADNVSKAFPGADFSGNHPNQKLVRTFLEIIDVESPAVDIVDISTTEINNMKDETEEIIRNHQDNCKHWKDIRGEDQTPELESWGSNVTNPSETMPNLENDFSRMSNLSDKDSDAPFSNNINQPIKFGGASNDVSDVLSQP